MKLVNPIPYKERCEILSEFLGHDSSTPSIMLGQLLTSMMLDKGDVRFDDSYDFICTDINVSKKVHNADEINMFVDSIRNCGSGIARDFIYLNSGLNKFMENMHVFSKYIYGGVDFNIQNSDKIKKLLSFEDLLISCFSNLFKNARKIGANKIILDFQEHPNMPYPVLYESTTHRELNRGGWIEISLQDNGKGFGDVDLEKAITREYSTSGGGFGLYFVKHMCDYLGANLDIKSELGVTKVSMFHPVYIDS